MSNLAHKRDRKNPMMNTPELFQSSQVFRKNGNHPGDPLKTRLRRKIGSNRTRALVLIVHDVNYHLFRAGC